MSEVKSLQLYIRSGAVQGSIEQTLKGRAEDFTTSLLTVINGNPVLQECDAQEVVRTALKAASMRLPIDPNLGLAYIIPYQNNKKIREEYEDSKGIVRYRDTWVKKYEPQLQIGWKGFVQLALRTKQYLVLNVDDVREGEYVRKDRLSGRYEFSWIEDETERESKNIVGYFAHFELVGGMTKTLYMTNEKLTEHAKKYSKSFANGNGKWKDDFDSMARKTVVKLLISKWGPQSTEIQKALRADQAAMGDDDSYNYVDNQHADGSNSGDAGENNATPPSPHDDTVEGEVVDPPASPDVDQTPKQPTEAEASQEPPKVPLNDRANQWAAKRKAQNAAERDATDGK